jgi:hypothetical protein
VVTDGAVTVMRTRSESDQPSMPWLFQRTVTRSGPSSIHRREPSTRMRSMMGWGPVMTTVFASPWT